jgi:alpha-galactosidase
MAVVAVVTVITHYEHFAFWDLQWVHIVQDLRVFHKRFFETNAVAINGAISNLPNDCIVEVPGYVDKNGINIPRVGELPLACAATCQASINVQRMSVRAAVAGDVTLLKQAMLHDPLTAAVCNPPEIWQLTDEMLVAQAQWLPQYKHAISAAKKRLATEKPLGTQKWKGAARLRTKTIAEMKKDAQKNRELASAADKAAAQRAKQMAKHKKTS